MRNKTIFSSCILLIAAAAVGFFFTPHWAVRNMRQAAVEKDAVALSDYVDYPALRESLKANFNAMMVREVAQNKSDNPFEAFGAALAAALVNPMIDALVTPESLAMLMAGERPPLEKPGAMASGKPSVPEPDRHPVNKSEPDMSMGYENFNRFVVKVKEKDSSERPVEFVLKREGLISWKLSALRLPFLEENKIPKPTTQSVAASTQRSQTHKADTKHKPEKPDPPLLSPILSNKRYQPSDISRRVYEDAVWFDVTWDTSKLPRATRAVKGILIIADIFGEPKLRLKWTINDPLIPGRQHLETGVGFEYNQFKDSHKWVRNTDLQDMTFRFEVTNIIYQDGIKQEF